MAIVEDLQCLPVRQPAFELRFQDLCRHGRALSFPCDASGRVSLGELSAAGRANYLRACEAVGRLYSVPTVRKL
jgi:hypothetical protein